MGTADQKDFRKYEREARELHAVLRRQARRPFVVEITGTPKAGKTTLITMLDTFLQACGWRVRVMKERAEDCPLPMKGHFFFNTWTTSTMLAELLNAVDQEDDLVILDRGLFDALVWLELQRRNSQVSETERAAFETFITLERWRNLIDSVALLQVTPKLAMARENPGGVAPRVGSIMNQDWLGRFNTALRAVKARHKNDFLFEEIQNSDNQERGVQRLLAHVLAGARNWSDPTIAVITRQDAQKLVPGRVRRWTPATWRELKKFISFRCRSEVEDDERWVQPLVCGAQTYASKVFLAIRRRPRDGVARARENTARVWTGCHVKQPSDGNLSMQHFKNELSTRLKSDLHLAELDIKPKPLGLVWSGDGDERTHLGVIFEVPVSKNVADFLDERQFKTNGRGYLVKNSFVEPARLLRDEPANRDYTLEEWSRWILNEKWLTKR